MGVINLVDPRTGQAQGFDDRLDAAKLATALRKGWKEETPAAGAQRTVADSTAEQYGGGVDQASAILHGAASGATLGGFDVLERLVNPEGARVDARQRAANPTEAGAASALGALGGALTGVGPAGWAAKAGGAIAHAAPEAGAVARIGLGVLGGAAEGGTINAGQGVSDLALANDELSVDRIAGELTHRFLYGAIPGGAIGGATKALEVALHAAGRGLSQAAEATKNAGADGTLPEDIAPLVEAHDITGVNKAAEAETAQLKVARDAQRAPFVDETRNFREMGQAEKPWTAVATGGRAGRLAKMNQWREATAATEAADAEVEAAQVRLAETKARTDEFPPHQVDVAREYMADATANLEQAKAAAVATRMQEEIAQKALAPRWVTELGKRTFDADAQVRRLLNNPKNLAEKPGLLKAPLQMQEAAYEEMLARKPELDALHLADKTDVRSNALALVQKHLDANRALQAQIESLTSPLASPRLTAITDAAERMKVPKPPDGLLKKIVKGTAYGAVSGVAHHIPVVGNIMAPFLGAGAADAIGNLGAKLSGVLRASGERSMAAAKMVASVGTKLEPVAPILATKVLNAARFAPRAAVLDQTDPGAGQKRSELEVAYEARSKELASQTMPNPLTGEPMMRPDARANIAGLLKPLAALAPVLADRLETHAVRRAEYLAKTRPHYTQIGMTRVPPSEMQIRGWARRMAASDDCDGIERRVALGLSTPEDAETMQACFPARYQDFLLKVAENLPTLRTTLPSRRRLSLSIFTGQPVDAALNPAVLKVLQGAHIGEMGTSGGMRAPQPLRSGSLPKTDMTPAQRRQQGIP